jgi:uncharacterized protein (DUF2126 family)
MPSDTPSASKTFDVEQAFKTLAGMADALALNAREVLAAYQGVVFKVPGESDDPLDYRDDRNPNGQLSEVGQQVMLALLKLGLTDEQVSVRMNVTPHGIAQRRRGWGRKYGQKG